MTELWVELVVLGRVALAALLGGLLGWERLTAGKSAGVRTLTLVSAASALFVASGGLALLEAAELRPGADGDPIRVVQAVAIGIGFLGAGVVFVERGERRVHGLTTAATIWATAAVGSAAGLGRFVLCGGATILMLVVLRVVAWFEPTPRDRRG